MSKRKSFNPKKVPRPTSPTDKIPSEPRGFYADALSNVEKERLPEARQLEGLDEEIALLRVKLNQLVAEHPDDMDGLVKAVRLLLQAVATKYRLSPQAKNDLYESFAGVMKGIGGMMLPEAFRLDKEE
ncbi:MAG: hypothetical protein HW384_816 [Dehalococcoidia bacterium]|nr:hypothetical protein [Dehalococcoidia bacterium]